MLRAIVVVTLACAATAEGGEIADLHRELASREVDFDKSRSHEQVEADDHEITEIGLERTPCFGSCPVYTVIIKSDGRVRYVGERFVSREGEHTGRVRTWSFNALAQFIRDTGYMDLEDNYSRLVTDHPTVYTTVVMNGTRKVIKNYANAGPTNLWAVEQIIDKLLLETEWDGEDER